MRGKTPLELAAVLAWPAALPWSAAVELPAVPPDRGIVVFALPRSNADSSALDRLLKKGADNNAGLKGAQTMELFFLYAGDAENGAVTRATALGDIASASETCVHIYNQRPGVRARGMCGIPHQS
jgi:hypothetical protein